MLSSKTISHRFLPQITKIRHLETSSMPNRTISPILTNRNPRNLEKMRIGYKPDGYHVERKGRNFWHKLDLTVTGRYVTARISHFRNGEVLRASTKEWALQKQLYNLTDHSAYINLARVLAQRCLETGIGEFYCDLEGGEKHPKLDAFLRTLEENGLSLKELDQFKPSRPWDLNRPEKPWDVSE